MENKAHALAAGAFVLAVLALLLGLALWLTKDANVGRVYEISSSDPVNGLQNQAPVRYKGVLIGKVTRMGFDDRNAGHVLIRVEVEPHAPVSQTTYATLNTQGITGLSFVQLNDDAVGSPPLDTSRDVPARIPLRQGLLDTLGDRGTAILDKVDLGLTNLNRLFNNANQERIAKALDNLAQAAGNTSQLAARLDSTVARQLNPALAALPATLAGADKTLQSVESTARALEQTAADFRLLAQRLGDKDGALQRLGESADALAKAANAVQTVTLPRLHQLGEESTHTAQQFSRTADLLRDNPQALVFGKPRPAPGPGEAGFVAPAAASRP